MFRFEVVDDSHRKHPDASIQLPRRSSRNACAYDFYCPKECLILPGETVMVWTDVKAVLPARYMLMLNVRSSMGKHLITLANTQGWVDSDYANNPDNDGNIGLMLHNGGDRPYIIQAGDRIAQGMIVKYYMMDDDFADQYREGGFGSTGK